MTIKADSKFSFEEDTQRAGRPIKYPWDTMKVGDSFQADSMANAYSLARYTTLARLPKKFKAAKMKDGTIRIFRIK